MLICVKACNELLLLRKNGQGEEKGLFLKFYFEVFHKFSSKVTEGIGLLFDWSECWPSSPVAVLSSGWIVDFSVFYVEQGIVKRKVSPARLISPTDHGSNTLSELRYFGLDHFEHFTESMDRLEHQQRFTRFLLFFPCRERISRELRFLKYIFLNVRNCVKKLSRELRFLRYVFLNVRKCENGLPRSGKTAEDCWNYANMRKCKEGYLYLYSKVMESSLVRVGMIYNCYLFSFMFFFDEGGSEILRLFLGGK